MGRGGGEEEKLFLIKLPISNLLLLLRTAIRKRVFGDIICYDRLHIRERGGGGGGVGESLKPKKKGFFLRGGV